MQAEELLAPLSDDLPCGPDLKAEDDADFMDYYYGVEGRMPERFFNIATGMAFDRSQISLAAEYRRLSALLARSRDLQLLVIAAKFEALAGDVPAFAATVDLISRLMERYPAQVHPVDSSDRADALAELDALQTVIFPLDDAVLVQDRREGDVTLRGWLVAHDRVPRRSEEDPYDPGGLVEAISRAEHAGKVEQLHGLSESLTAALSRIADTARTTGGPVPRLERLTERVGALRDMIRAARSDLEPGTETAEAAETEDGDTTEGAGASAAPAPTVAFRPGQLKSHAEARDHLIAVETYIRRFEPSSPALVLVVQARRLIGRPLVEALDVLLGSEAERARIEFGTESGFALPMAQMRLLSDTDANDIPAEALEPADLPPHDPPAPVNSRDHAGKSLKQIEDFFRKVEPTSPIPILLFRAKATLGRDFQSLLRELFPRD
jgi:type VI secretion system protein ImpA